MTTSNLFKLVKWVVVGVALFYIIPYLLLGQNAYVRLHDTLEGEWMWLKLLADSHNAFTFDPTAIVPQQMKGLPRDAFPTGFSLNMLLVQQLGAYYGYLTSALILHIAGFAGMIVLLRDYFLKKDESRYIVWSVALMFGVLPVFIPFGLSVMGQPLLLWAFLNLHGGRKKWLSWALIGLLPFYSSVVWVLVPGGTFLGLLWLYFVAKEKRFNTPYFVGLVVMAVMYLAVNYNIVTSSFLAKGFVPHRVAYNLYMFDKPNFGACLLDTFFNFTTTHYHVSDFVTLAVIVALILVFRKSEKVLIALVVGIVLVCFFQGFYPYFEYALYKKISLVNSFRFNRFSIVLPFFWLLAFAIALEKMRNTPILARLVLPLIVVQLFVTLYGNDEVLHNYRTLVGHQKFPNYQNYLAPNQFASIKQYINKPQNSYYVASLGLSPTIAQYNGFYTLDGLASIYDLNYKNQFRKVFLGEIEKSHDVKQYFDGWGNRCYIFSAELGTKASAYSCYKFQHRSIADFDFDAKAFADMGGKYLVSAVEIKNCQQHGLQLEGIFNDDQSWWTIYLYSVKPATP